MRVFWPSFSSPGPWCSGQLISASMRCTDVSVVQPIIRQASRPAMRLQWQSPPRASQRKRETTSRYEPDEYNTLWSRSLINVQNEAALPTPDPPSDSQTAALVGEHAQYMVATYVRPPPMMAKGEGCYLWDVENRKYLDFTAGIAVNALGHCDPEMSKLLYQQVAPPFPSLHLTSNPNFRHEL